MFTVSIVTMMKENAADFTYRYYLTRAQPRPSKTPKPGQQSTSSQQPSTAPRKADAAMRIETPKTGTQQHQQWRRNPPIALRVRQRRPKQLRVGEQVAVVARQHHAGESVVLERARRDGLAAGLERDRGQGNQHLPVQLVGRRRRRCCCCCITPPCDDRRGQRNHGRLQRVRREQHPSPRRREPPMEPGKRKGAQAERADGRGSFEPSHVFVRCNDAQAQLHRVA